MGRRCIAAGCSNTTKNGVSLHKFPSDKRIRKQWILQIKKNRADWSDPTAYSEVCSDHFTKDCFEGIAEKIGMKMKHILKPDAVPTTFPRRSSIPKVTRGSTAYGKRERARVSFGISSLQARLPYIHNQISIRMIAQKLRIGHDV